MAYPLRDITGQKFGRLTVLYRSGTKNFACGKSHVLWYCECDCGRRRLASGQQLKNGDAKSCGCLAIEMFKSGGPKKWTPLYGKPQRSMRRTTVSASRRP